MPEQVTRMLVSGAPLLLKSGQFRDWLDVGSKELRWNGTTVAILLVRILEYGTDYTPGQKSTATHKGPHHLRKCCQSQSDASLPPSLGLTTFQKSLPLLSQTQA